MANTLILSTPFVFVGLGTLTYTVPAAGNYSIFVQVTEIPPSGLSMVVNKNGSPVYTAPALGQTQSAEQFKFSAPFALNDVITVVLASGSAIDSQYNNVKSTISLTTGL